MMADEVTIVLATHNGAAHLGAQLDSLLAQDHRRWRLVAGDDGSVDGTRDILERFGQANPGRLAGLRDGPLQGAAANFLTLLAAPEAGEGPVALCDQDDVWLPGKLSRALEALSLFPPETPAIYAARVTYAGPDLRPIGGSPHWRRGPSFSNALVENVTGGHTLVLSPAALRLLRARPGAPPKVPFHDWWMYLLMTAAGGRVVLDPAEVLLYRQHPGNALGARRGLPAAYDRLGRLLRGEMCSWMAANLHALGDRADWLTPEARRAMSALGAAPTHGTARAATFARLGLHRQHAASTAALYFAAAMGRI